MKKICIIGLLLLLLFSCAAQTKSSKKGSSGKPKWLENPKSVYPDTQYMTAIGEGDTHQAAQNMAAGNLSRIFEMKVKADETIMQRASELIRGNETKLEEQVNVEKHINIFSSQQLMNVQFADSYTNEYGRIFVLAYLNRMKTAEIYEEKIDANSAQIVYYSKELQKETDVLKQYAFANAANVISETNHVLLEQLSIISSMSREMISLPYNANDVKRSKVEIAKSIRFTIDVEGDSENKIAISLQDFLTEMGFTAGEEGNLRISGAISLEDADLKREDGFEFVRYDLQLKMQTNAEEIIAAFSKNGREGHTTKREATARVYRKLSKDLGLEFSRKIDEYFVRLVIR